MTDYEFTVTGLAPRSSPGSPAHFFEQIGIITAEHAGEALLILNERIEWGVIDEDEEIVITIQPNLTG